MLMMFAHNEAAFSDDSGFTFELFAIELASPMSRAFGSIGTGDLVHVPKVILESVKPIGHLKDTNTIL